MATGLIDVNILKPELAGSFAAGYRGAEQARLQSQEAKQSLEFNQAKLEQFKQDRAALTDLQTKLRAAGQSDDPNQFFKAMIQTGNPDYMAKGYEGLQRYQELQRAEVMLAKEFGTGAAATAPAAQAPSVMRPAPVTAAAAAATQPMNALGSGTFGVMPEAAPVNALTASQAPAMAQPSPTNALAAPQDRVQELRRKIVQLGSVNDPRLKSLAGIYQNELNELIKPQVVGAGATVYRGGQPVFTAPSAPPAPTQLARLQSEMNALPPNDPRRAQYAALIKKETTHAPGVNVSMVSEKAEQGARGKMLVDQYSDISKAAALATKTLPSIETTLNTLNKGLETGFGTETKAAGARLLGALGVKDAEKFATDTQVFQSSAMQALMQKQLEQKGPQTESDAMRLEQIGAQLGKTKDANRFILDAAKEQLRRDVEQRNFYDRWYTANKTYDGAENAWFTGEGGKSLFERPALKKYLTSESAAAQIPTAATPAPAPAVPQAAVDALKAGRGTDAQFDAIFGPGAAKRARGGK